VESPPDPQNETYPTLVPNVAGEVERQLVSPDQRLYRLGWWGSDDSSPRVGAVAGSGFLLGIRPAPITAEDLSPGLRSYYKDFHLPAVEFINSSVAHYVEVSWRWFAAVERLAQVEELGSFTFRAQIDDSLREFLRGLADIDPGIDSCDPPSQWQRRILDA
jgi:hypothetical protein